jgi:SAM-dependent methyltransferase
LAKNTYRFTSLIQHVKPGKIVELGCGSGLVLEALSKDFADSIIVGLDVDKEQLEKVLARGLKNVIPLKADIIQKIFPDGTFDTALFVASLHEVFSYRGRKKVRVAFQIAHDMLMDSGILIVQDFLKPPSRLVKINFLNEEAGKRFLRFAREFRPRKVRDEESRGAVELDIADAVEFASKYRSPDEEDWQEEMRETHFFFTEEEYQEMAQRTGFVIKDFKKLPTDESWWVEIRENMELTLEPQYLWVQLVLTKRVGS